MYSNMDELDEMLESAVEAHTKPWFMYWVNLRPVLSACAVLGLLIWGCASFLAIR